MKPILLTFLLASFTVLSAQTFEKEDLKEQAYQVLLTKCNSCHEQKNKNRVFTLDNMDRFGKKIYRQVFKWKRMPKGTTVKLTTEEYEQLKSWLSSLNIK